jgi:glycosyltransferase involved in cell wall biosynthesis
MMVITGLGMGGAEQVVVSLSDALASKGCDVLLIHLTGLAEIFPKNPKVKLVNLGMKSKLDFFNSLIKLRTQVISFKPDIVHSHMFHANIIARLLRLIVRIPRLICSAHSGNEGSKLRMLVYRITDVLADISTNVSTSAVELFIKKKASKLGRIISVYNGIDSDLFSFNFQKRLKQRQSLLIEENCPMILAVGRLHKAKDYPNLFYALTKLPVGLINYKLCIVGEGSLKLDLEELANDLQLKDKILFLGVRHDVADLMSAADVFVLSSAWEGFGLVVAEAMSCERVIVATDCGGVKEVVGDAGFLVKPQDSEALAKALYAAINLPVMQSKALGCAARKRVIELYSLEVALEKWLKLYAN